MMEASKYANVGMAGAIQPGREPGVLENAIHSAACGVSELSAALDNLERLMCQVLRPTPPTPTGDGKNLAQVNPVTSPAVERLHSERRRIEMLTNRVNDLASRVEG